MLPQLSEDLVHGWVSSPNNRGTRDILYSCLATIWLCTWTCLCLNIPPAGSRRGPSVILYKVRWQFFAILFPDVLVANAAEQWLSARQSVREFARITNHNRWTLRHGFYADMGCILIHPLDHPPFPIDSQQLAFLVDNRYISYPEISLEEIRSVNKADGLARLVTLFQIGWFCISSVARLVEGLKLTSLEVTTIAFIICTIHTFSFWYRKPLDPETQRIIPMQHEIGVIRQHYGIVRRQAGFHSYDEQTHDPFSVTPLDFLKPAPDPRSLVTPFWYGLNIVVGHKYSAPKEAATTFPNSRVRPQDGVLLVLSLYILAFQFIYYALHIGFAWLCPFPSRLEFFMWTVSNATCFGLILTYILGIPVGTRMSPYFGRCLFDTDTRTVLEIAEKLPRWASLLVHGPFIFLYVGGRAIVLVESLISLRAQPGMIYQDISWSNFFPHV